VKRKSRKVLKDECVYFLQLRYGINGVSVIAVTHSHETSTRNLYAALFRASFCYQKLSNTTDQSNCTILVTCIGASFWSKFLQLSCASKLERVSPPLAWVGWRSFAERNVNTECKHGYWRLSCKYFLWLHITVALFSPCHVSGAGMQVVPHNHVTLMDAEIV